MDKEKIELSAHIVEWADGKKKRFIEVSDGNTRLWLTICEHVAMARREWGEHRQHIITHHVPLSTSLTNALIEHWFKKSKMDTDREILCNLLSILRNQYDTEIARIIESSNTPSHAQLA